MKNIIAIELSTQGIRVISYERFADQRGYFTETFRKSQLSEATAGLVGSSEIVQANESFSRMGTLRGLHFQWNPHMGKLVRTVHGRMIDLFLDIRLGSPTFGCISAYDMPASREGKQAQWIWIPPGFAHGNMFPEDTIIECLCTGEYNGNCEAGISPLAPDLNWTLCDSAIKQLFDKMVSSSGLLLTEKDRNGLSVAAWRGDRRASNFMFRGGA
jgi:dTDP-4-dehydrorhamnose 3,5-epimerase